MKVIRLHQPWASLITLGEKRFETRSWDRQYLGRQSISKSPTKSEPPACNRLTTLRSSVARRPSDIPSKIGDKSPPTLAFVRLLAKMPSVG